MNTEDEIKFQQHSLLVVVIVEIHLQALLTERERERGRSWNARTMKDEEEMKDTRNCGGTCGVRGTVCIEGGGKEILVCVCVCPEFEMVFVAVSECVIVFMYYCLSVQLSNVQLEKVFAGVRVCRWHCVRMSLYMCQIVQVPGCVGVRECLQVTARSQPSPCHPPHGS